jgi:hypothetical protein
VVATLSRLASGGGEDDGARVKAAVAEQVREVAA